MNTRRILVILAVLLAIWSCHGETSAPESSPAEIPEAGPAVLEDSGPAPEGQWEPEIDEASSSTPKETSGTGPELPALDQQSRESSIKSPQQSSVAGQSVLLQLQTWDETEDLIASHRGKVVIVDFWATSCLPCRREFPHLVELQREFAADVACLSVSLDYSGRKSKPPEIYREKVLEFLVEQEAVMDNVLSTDDPDELQERLQLSPIPLVWIFDRAGVRRKTFHNNSRGGDEFTYATDIVPFVKSLLAEN